MLLQCFDYQRVERCVFLLCTETGKWDNSAVGGFGFPSFLSAGNVADTGDLLFIPLSLLRLWRLTVT